MSESNPFPNLTRVHTDTGSHIEPPLDESWDNLTKLQWFAAVEMVDCPGLVIKVGEGGSWLYYVNVGHSCHGGLTYAQALTFLNGVSTGARIIRVRGADDE